MAKQLPDAVPRDPVCVACGSETYSDGEQFVCEDCQLVYDKYDFSASFTDPDAKVCGHPCDNTWHGDGKIEPGKRFDCGTCLLPSGHKSRHYTGCEWVS